MSQHDVYMSQQAGQVSRNQVHQHRNEHKCVILSYIHESHLVRATHVWSIDFDKKVNFLELNLFLVCLTLLHCHAK